MLNFNNSRSSAADRVALVFYYVVNKVAAAADVPIVKALHKLSTRLNLIGTRLLREERRIRN
jgi:hypothetical protein